MLIIVFLCGILSANTPAVKQIRLKNGANIIYTASDSKRQSVVVGVFIKGGGALKFNMKTGFSSLADNYVRNKLNNLAKSEGFRYRSFFTWDYASYIFYLPRSFIDGDVTKLWSVIFGQGINDKDFYNVNTEVVSKIRSNMTDRINDEPLISFMSALRSVYSAGLLGDEEDVLSIKKDEFEKFLFCYQNPNNTVIVVDGLDKPYEFAKTLEGFKPCFQNDKYEKESVIKFNLPDKSIHYFKSNVRNSIVRIGFPSASCVSRDTYVYDLLSVLIERDPDILALADTVRVFNECHANGGIVEVVFDDIKQDNDVTAGRFVDRLVYLSRHFDVSTLPAAKKQLENKFFATFTDKAQFVSLIGNAKLTSGDFNNFLDYSKSIRSVGADDIKSVLKKISPESLYQMSIKLEE